MSFSIAVINGPNLNLLGSREPHLYGNKTLEKINHELTEAFKGKTQFEFFQSNHEGEIIDHIQHSQAKAIIINPGALTHTSIALRDALLAKNISVVEVHLSNIFAREEFRKHSVISDICLGVISGFSDSGYHFAVEALLKQKGA